MSEDICPQAKLYKRPYLYTCEQPSKICPYVEPVYTTNGRLKICRAVLLDNANNIHKKGETISDIIAEVDTPRKDNQPKIFW